MSDLTNIGWCCGTDKVDSNHNFLHKPYTDLYAYYLKHLRYASFNFLEIGIKGGNSLKMWKNYFPNATIVGIDINPDCKKYEEDNIEIYIGSQEDEKFLKSIGDKYKNFGVILDDGSHINYMTIKSFEILNSYVTDFYIIEDLRNSYENLTKAVQKWPGMKYNKDLNPNNAKTRPDFDKVFLNLIKQMDYRRGRWTSFNFHSQMLVMEKNYSRISEG